MPAMCSRKEKQCWEDAVGTKSPRQGGSTHFLDHESAGPSLACHKSLFPFSPAISSLLIQNFKTSPLGSQGPWLTIRYLMDLVRVQQILHHHTLILGTGILEQNSPSHPDLVYPDCCLGDSDLTCWLGVPEAST